MLSALRSVRLRLRALFSHGHDRELREELDAHLEQLVEHHQANGLTPAAARAAAHRQFGNTTRLQERSHDLFAFGWLEALTGDVRQAARSLRRSPGFTFVSLLTLVVALGGLTTIFTLVNSILLRPLPYPAADRLVWMTQTHPGFPAMIDLVTAADLEDFSAQSRSFETLAAYDNCCVLRMDADTDPYRVRLIETDPSLLELLGAETVLGRPFVLGTPQSQRQVVVDHSFWTERLDGRDDVVGQVLDIPRGRTAVRATIAGVFPPSFALPVRGGAADYPTLWLTPEPEPSPDRRNPLEAVSVIGRLRPGVSLDAARTEIQGIAERLARTYPETNEGRTTALTPLADRVVGRTETALWLFLGAVACVLLIAVVNLTALQVVRNAAREHETHVRAALGAGRGRLVGHAVTESVVLGLAGGALGLLAGRGGLRLVLATLPSRLPRADEVAFQPVVFLGVLGVALTAGVVSSLIPVWRGTRPDLVTAIKDGGTRATLGARRGSLHGTLIAVETALALVLLVGAGLLAHSLGRLLTTDAGMDEERVWSVRVELPLSYGEEAQRQFWTTALGEIRALPQVDLAAMAAAPPLNGFITMVGGIRPEGEEGGSGNQGLFLNHRPVSAGYFRTLSIPILRGRSILDTDVAGAEQVVVLNETAARALWPDQDPIGRRLSGMGRDPVVVVGVASDVKQVQLDEEIGPQLYTAAAQGRPEQVASILVRLAPGATGFVAAAETVLDGLAADATLTINSMRQARWALVAEERFRTGVLLTFALTAVFLVVLGIAGVVSYTVVQRRREIGLRLVLGATPGDVVRLTVRRAMLAALAGAAIGLVASLGVARVLSGLLYEITATDPLTFIAALGGILLVATAASLAPASRATRINPAEILRDS